MSCYWSPCKNSLVEMICGAKFFIGNSLLVKSDCWNAPNGKKPTTKQQQKTVSGKGLHGKKNDFVSPLYPPIPSRRNPDTTVALPTPQVITDVA